MVSAIPNPALDAFAAQIGAELVLAQVLVRRDTDTFPLQHVDDRDEEQLRDVLVAELRDIAQFTAAKQFRPLKSAPNLQRGWRFVARSVSELGFALDCLYPGAVADWFATQQPAPPVTHYREFTGRQTGMYRVTALLSDEQVAQVARAGCHRRFCLKQRIWTVEGLPAETISEKSLVPCLEPCAVLLEFARTVARIEQKEKEAIAMAPDEIETVRAALDHAAEIARRDSREADFSAAENPRRVQWMLEKLRPRM
jgi:hypothetical protein